MGGVKRRFLCGVIVSLALAVGAPLTVLASDVGNGSFEDGDFPQGFAFQTLSAGTPGATSITGWTVTSGQVDWIDTYWTPQDGTKSLDLNGFEPGAIAQTLVTDVNGTYAVKFYLAGNPDCGPSDKTLTVGATGAAPQSYTFTNTGAATHDNMGWTVETYTFVATATSTVLSFTADPGNISFCGPALDAVSLTETTPPPPPPPPPTGADCKDGGWRSMSDDSGQPFKNQGDCVSSFATAGETPIGR
jgi:choice-of-anchor C domain-containing protein